ncbi:MAG: DUF177 domain-containing protein [Clostridiales bacterium]|nr:DUF177 domain-containing protein [Clostridiales bacterium]MCF8022586.1 DUF177 domain-containing protein [Clostridiales bacterium]
MLKLDIKKLKEEKGGQEHFDINSYLPDFVEGDYKITFAGPAGLSIDMTNSNAGILMTGKVTVKVYLNCDRCLAPFEYQVNTKLFETYYDEENAVSRAQKEAEEFIPFSGDEIDIQPEVIEAIILAMPVKALCKEDCKGLCPLCGTNLNYETCDCQQEKIDPRLSKLKELLK